MYIRPRSQHQDLHERRPLNRHATPSPVLLAVPHNYLSVSRRRDLHRSLLASRLHNRRVIPRRLRRASHQRTRQFSPRRIRVVLLLVNHLLGLQLGLLLSHLLLLQDSRYRNLREFPRISLLTILLTNHLIDRPPDRLYLGE